MVHGLQDLRKMWKDVQNEYDKVIAIFLASGNINSIFTKALAMKVLNPNHPGFTREEEDDVFGIEERGFCCFTNSVVLVYLCMWMNEKPGMTSFVSKKKTEEMKIDSQNGGSSSLAQNINEDGNEPCSSFEAAGAMIGRAIKELVEARIEEYKERQQQHNDRQAQNAEMFQSINRLLHCSATSAQIELVGKQIEGLKRKRDECLDAAKKIKI